RALPRAQPVLLLPRRPRLGRRLEAVVVPLHRRLGPPRRPAHGRVHPARRAGPRRRASWPRARRPGPPRRPLDGSPRCPRGPPAGPPPPALTLTPARPSSAGTPGPRLVDMSSRRAEVVAAVERRARDHDGVIG